jgi:hypothetical protein
MAVLLMLPSVRGLSSFHLGVMSRIIIFYMLSFMANSLPKCIHVCMDMTLESLELLHHWLALRTCMMAVLEGSGNDRHEAVDSES